MDFKQNYFEIFQLPQQFQVDQELLADRYRQLQRSVHPDKYAGASDRDRRLSMQWTTQINEAYSALKSPLPRAIYLLKLAGIDMAGRENAQVEPSFLMEQISLREDLDDIEEDDEALPKLDDFKARVSEVMASLEEEFTTEIERDTEGAAQVVLKMQFMNKLMHAANQLEEKLLDY